MRISKDRFRERYAKEIMAKAPDDSTVGLAFTMLDAFLALMAEVLEECDRELWERLRAECTVH